MQPLDTQDPRAIGPYRLLGRLGAGGMGRVYLGRSAGGRTVAVKVVHPHFAADRQFRERFRREVASARRVGGSWTAPVLDADPEAAVPWVATGYVAGPALSEAVAAVGPLPEHTVRVLGAGLAEALAAVHGLGLVHRDVKPSNVLLTMDGPRLIDFGIARATDATASLTASGVFIGSPGYMSPEQILGREVTGASDVFSLGAVLAYAARGSDPFPGDSSASLLYKVVHDEPELEGLEGELRELVACCLGKDPVGRPDPAELARRLGPLRGDGAVRGPVPSGWLPGPLVEGVGRRAVELLGLEADGAGPGEGPGPESGAGPGAGPEATPGGEGRGRPGDAGGSGLVTVVPVEPGPPGTGAGEPAGAGPEAGAGPGAARAGGRAADPGTAPGAGAGAGAGGFGPPHPSYGRGLGQSEHRRQHVQREGGPQGHGQPEGAVRARPGPGKSGQPGQAESQGQPGQPGWPGRGGISFSASVTATGPPRATDGAAPGSASPGPPAQGPSGAEDTPSPGSGGRRRVSCVVMVSVAAALAIGTSTVAFLDLLPGGSRGGGGDAAAPSGDTGESPPAQAEPSAPTVPEKFTGTWQGGIVQSGGFPNGELTLVLKAGKKGATVARMTYSALGTACYAKGELVSAGEKKLVLRETTDTSRGSSGALCTGEPATVTLTSVSADRLRYASDDDKGGRPTADLRRAD
ncbi:serine/threonine-protein kinase [Streptomyces xinghaiensis]|uniref:Serine/threonine protein kinase n=2 Tax=Streptomyces TaxID=1883 RepID=A0A420V1H6_9ACTN|nr:serine/threonine-protein kinase [Streptomyces xinghaiensis]PQM21447.1 serine/threonine protein kinase [Streptomyces xinghaiensis]RKM94493.1 serine/threonine protein kinase [Streptomyces xinghaiensis]RNC72092.1 serine/threonine protein kinase [Streptomyces xinghaiensis]